MRLVIVSATAAGVALASPVVAVADESAVIEAAPIDENADSPAVEITTNEPLVIELVVEGDPPTDSTEIPSDGGNDPTDSTEIPSDEGNDPTDSTETSSGDGDPPTESTETPSGDQPGEPAEDNAAPPETSSEPVVADPEPVTAALETGSTDEHTGETGGEHTGGGGTGGSETEGEHTEGEHTGGGGTGGEHTGGQHSGGGGTGNPYRMTFVVSWRLADDTTIPVLDSELPTDWRSLFDLAAASATGSGKPTSAHCTYPEGSTDLVCEFKNPGHETGPEGMVVPAKPSATYSVTVLWPSTGWTIDGANAGPYSARDLCPRGGHDGGHGGTHEAEALEAEGFVCLHTVVMRRAPVTPEPPVKEPPAEEPPAQKPPASEVPAVEPPESQTPAPPETAPTTPVAEVLPPTVTPRTLPATGNTATTTLMIATIILGLGGCLSVLARRRNDLPLD